MNFWIYKSEPETYSIQQLSTDKKTNWNGVRNYQARNNLKLAKVKDLVLIYHSGKEKAIVGLAEISREAFPDEDWVQVEIKFKKIFQTPILLAELKKHKTLKDIQLVKQSRLSVSSVSKTDFELIVSIGE